MTPAISDNKTAKKIIYLSTPVRWFREFLSLFLWASVFLHVFVLNVDDLVVHYFPFLGPIIAHRFLAFIGINSFIWLVLRNPLFLRFFGYIYFYPFVLLIWHIPRIAFKNWAVLIAFFPAIYSAFVGFRVNFIVHSFVIIAAFMVSLSGNTYLIVTCMTFISLYLVQHFYRRFRIAYAPSTIFPVFGKIAIQAWDNIQKTTQNEPVSELTPDSDEYVQKYGQSLLSIFMLSTALHFFGEKLREVINSRKVDIYLLGLIISTVMITVFVFSIEYLGLERVTQGSFSGVDNPSFIKFLGFSFNTLMTSDVSGIKAVSDTAQLFTYLQLFSTFLILILLVFVILTSIRERYRQDLDGVIEDLGKVSAHIGGFLESNYNLTHMDLENWLLNFNPQVTIYCLKLRYGEKRTQEILGKNDQENS